MRFVVENVAFRGVARNAIALACALGSVPVAVLNILHVVPGSPMLTIVVGCAVAAAVGFAPSSDARGRERGIVEIVGSTLRVEIGARRHAWETREVAGAWTEADGLRVVLRDRLGRQLSFDAASASEAEAFLAAASLGPGVRVTRIPIGGAKSGARAAGLMFGTLFFTALGLFFTAALVRTLRMGDTPDMPPLTLRLSLYGIAACIVCGSLLLARRCYVRVRVVDVVVGRDGVLISRMLLPSRRISLSRVVVATVVDDSLTVVTRGRPLVLRAANQAQARAVADAITAAMRRYTSTSRGDRTLLQRDGRSAADWTAHLASVSEHARTYRSGFEAADLVAIAEDPVTPPEDRIAATLILARVEEAYRPRLRVAAEGTVDPHLRTAMLSAIDDGLVADDALRRIVSRAS